MPSEWEAFLHDKELDGLVKFSPRSKYLFGKILHDLLQYLNAHRFWVRLILEGYQLSHVPQTTLQGLQRNQPLVEQMIVDVQAFWQFEKEVDVTSDKWPVLIQKIANQVEELPKLIEEIEQLPLPSNEVAEKLIEATITSLKRAEHMRVTIHNKAYKKLWLMNYQSEYND